MHYRHLPGVVGSLVIVLSVVSEADEQKPRVGAKRLKPAIEKSIKLIESTFPIYVKERKCFSCHNQAIPIIALDICEDRGIKIDRKAFDGQVAFVADFFKRNQEKFDQAKGTGGQVDTAGYAMWALDAGKYKANDLTKSISHYLIEKFKNRDFWRCTSDRPPSETSDITTTFLASRALNRHATTEQKAAAQKRLEKAKKWLLEKAKPEDTEDQVFLLRGLHEVGAGKSAIQSAAEKLMALQQKNGGWAQTKEMESDPYATGTALVALVETGHLKATDAAYQKGVEFLLKTQEEDGSWYVGSRSDPFQKYFETGFPHDADQYISISASAWATAALAYALP